MYYIGWDGIQYMCDRAEHKNIKYRYRDKRGPRDHQRNIYRNLEGYF